MIHTSRQLKALVRNQSHGDSTKAQTIIRSYMMERFLERVSLSPYRENFILKGGMLVSALVGLNNRSTMDIDATMKNMPLTTENVEEIVKEVIRIPVEDGITFQVKNISEIMEEEEYGGIRLSMEAVLDEMKIPLKLDISTGDAITPREVAYDYWIMFEKRSIPIMAYNLETVLAEKLETVLSRGVANTRLRDFYDIHVLQDEYGAILDVEDLKKAFTATCRKRGTAEQIPNGWKVMDSIRWDKGMEDLWHRYQKKFDYAADIPWDQVMDSIRDLYRTATAERELGKKDRRTRDPTQKDREI